MNKNIYENKLDELYVLVLNKFKNNTKIENRIDEKFHTFKNNIENKINILEKTIENNTKIENRINEKLDIFKNNIENKLHILENTLEHKLNFFNDKINSIDKKINNISFYLNLLYIQYYYKDFININKFLFQNKSNIILKKSFTYNILKGHLTEDDNNNIILKCKKNINHNISYIILTFYKKDVLINNYKFNYLLNIKKINNNTFTIISNNLDYTNFYKQFLTNNKYHNIYFYKIDQLIDIINS